MDLSTVAIPLLSIITLFVMAGSLLLILVPAVPVSALQWALAMLLGVFSGFTRLTPAAAVIITGLMVLGSTSQFWMPLLGLRGDGLSCMGLIAFFVGMALGTAFIPIPIIGSLIGGLIAVIIVEFARIKEMRQALRRGGLALKQVIYGMIAEFVFAVTIFAVTLISVLTTA